MLRARDSFKKAKDEEFAICMERVKSVLNIPEGDIQVEKYGVSGGGYGVVSFGTYRRKNVVKKDFRFLNTIVERIYNYREVYALSTCNHPNIVTFIGAGPNTQMADISYVVIERATDASLKELIYSEVEYSVWHVMLWALHLTDGLDYLHSRAEPIIHRDLKPDNMLLFDGCTTLKISDFGSSKIFEASKEEMQSVNQGSLMYMAPEVQQRGRDEYYTCYSKTVDIYSMTISLWEMMTRRLDQDINPHSVQICFCPPFLKSLFDRGMSVDPCLRPSASQLVLLFDFIMRKVCTKTNLQLRIDLENTQLPSTSPRSRTCTKIETGFSEERELEALKLSPRIVGAQPEEATRDYDDASELVTMMPHFQITDCLADVLIRREKERKRRAKARHRHVRFLDSSDSEDS